MKNLAFILLAVILFASACSESSSQVAKNWSNILKLVISGNIKLF